MKRLIVPIFLVFTLIGHFIGGVLLGLALVPGFLVVRPAYRALLLNPDSLWRTAMFCISLGVGFFLFGYGLLLVLVFARHAFHLHNYEGDEPIISYPVFGVAAYNFLVTIARYFFLDFVRGTPMINWFYRGMGARIGRNTVVMTTRIYDCDMIEIGDNCVIGGNVSINAHTGERGRGVMRKVRIGNRVSIGADTMILPGVTIEDNVMIGANSLVPKDKILLADTTYGGVPIIEIPHHQAQLPPNQT